MAVKDQVEAIKSQFYSANEEAAEPDPLEEEFKAVLAQYKAKRAEVAAEVAKVQQTNLLRKQALLDEMKTMAEGETDGVMANLQRMRELQAEWKTIGEVPAPHVQEIRKAY